MSDLNLDLNLNHYNIIELQQILELKDNYTFDFVTVDKEGYINLEDLKKKATEDVLLFSYILVI